MSNTEATSERISIVHLSRPGPLRQYRTPRPVLKELPQTKDPGRAAALNIDPIKYTKYMRAADFCNFAANPSCVDLSANR